MGEGGVRVGGGRQRIPFDDVHLPTGPGQGQCGGQAG
jgi:hypothetical protein